MRRTYISSEYKNSEIYGTYNTVEESNFFGSKMLEIDDTISIENQNIIYYQKYNGEQIDISIESSLTSIIYSSSSDKLSNHIIEIDNSQTQYQKENNTRWIVNIDLDTILKNYLFAILKKQRTFEKMLTSMTKTNDVNSSINAYIENNVVDRFNYSSIDFFISYKDLSTQNMKKYENSWNPDIIKDYNKITKIQSYLKFDNSSIKLIFNQDNPSSKYSFEYYFNVLFKKI